MKIRIENELLPLISVALLLILVIALLDYTALRIILGLPFVLFIPGYTLLSALFPQRDSLSGIERTALGLGLSIAIIPLIGLAINYTPWGIGIYPILISITAFILATSAVAWYRRQRLPSAERFSVAVDINLPRWAGMGGVDKALSVSLAIAILVALGFIGYVIAVPKEGDRFTEFYILGIDGKAENYPAQVVKGETVELIIGLVNHEDEVMNYRIDIEINGSRIEQVTSRTLASGEKREQVVSFLPQNAGKSQKVEFWLYKDNEPQPYFKEPLHLYIDVNESPPS